MRKPKMKKITKRMTRKRRGDFGLSELLALDEMIRSNEALSEKVGAQLKASNLEHLEDSEPHVVSGLRHLRRELGSQHAYLLWHVNSDARRRYFRHTIEDAAATAVHAVFTATRDAKIKLHRQGLAPKPECQCWNCGVERAALGRAMKAQRKKLWWSGEMEDIAADMAERERQRMSVACELLSVKPRDPEDRDPRLIEFHSDQFFPVMVPPRHHYHHIDVDSPDREASDPVIFLGKDDGTHPEGTLFAETGAELRAALDSIPARGATALVDENVAAEDLHDGWIRPYCIELKRDPSETGWSDIEEGEVRFISAGIHVRREVKITKEVIAGMRDQIVDRVGDPNFMGQKIDPGEFARAFDEWVAKPGSIKYVSDNRKEKTD